MLFKKGLLIFSFFSFLLMAQNPVKDIALYKAVFEEKISWQNYGQPVRKMVPATKVKKGATLVYVNQIINKSHKMKRQVVVNNPIPYGSAYIRGTSSCEGICEMLYSIDDGRTFRRSEELFVIYGTKKRAAMGSEYTHIKFIFSKIPPMSKIRMAFKVVVK